MPQAEESHASGALHLQYGICRKCHNEAHVLFQEARLVNVQCCALYRYLFTHAHAFTGVMISAFSGVA